MKNWYEKHIDKRDIGAKIADAVASGMGSWKFIIIQTLIVFTWMTLNVVAWSFHWDVYPFILLNLVFSTQAAYASPIILMSQNRAAERDKIHAEHQYETTETEIQEIKKINEEQTKILKAQNEIMDILLKK